MERFYKAWVGIDVSKDTLAVCVLQETGKTQHKVVDNTPAGHAKLRRWVQHLVGDTPVHFALEATGAYSTPVAAFLVEAGQAVSVLNPAQVKYLALAQGAGNKTDKADARVIALYARQQQPPLWRLAAPEVQKLVALVRHRDNLLEHRVQQQNRLEQPGLDKSVQRSLTKLLAFLDKEIAAVEAQISDHIDNTPSLKADRELLESIPGVGRTTAHKLLAELPDVQQFSNAQAMACYAGLNPQEYQSGSSVHRRTRLSKRGSASLRAALYLPAMSAIVWNPLVKALYERLLAKGKCRMAALGAAMRKLLMLTYGVLKNRQKFDAAWSPKKGEATP